MEEEVDSDVGYIAGPEDNLVWSCPDCKGGFSVRPGQTIVHCKYRIHHGGTVILFHEGSCTKAKCGA